MLYIPKKAQISVLSHADVAKYILRGKGMQIKAHGAGNCFECKEFAEHTIIVTPKEGAKVKKPASGDWSDIAFCGMDCFIQFWKEVYNG